MPWQAKPRPPRARLDLNPHADAPIPAWNYGVAPPSHALGLESDFAMTVPVERTGSVEPEVRDPVDPAVVQDVAAWVGQLARTLKSSRLYDAANPTVVRFREELTSSLLSLLSRRGAVRLEVSSNALTYAGQ